MKHQFPAQIFVDSCGLSECDEDGADPFVIAVMAEIGVDRSIHRPKLFEALEDDSFDLIIALTPEAHARSVEMTRGRAIEVEFWPTPDPSLVTGSREAILQAYREVRDLLSQRISERFAQASTLPA